MISNCLYCGKTENLKLCTGCTMAYFCDVTCQKACWKNHKITCVKMSVGAQKFQKMEKTVGTRLAEKLDLAKVLINLKAVMINNRTIVEKGDFVFVCCEENSTVQKHLELIKNNPTFEKCEPLNRGPMQLYIFSFEWFRHLLKCIGMTASIAALEKCRMAEPAKFHVVNFFIGDEVVVQAIDKEVQFEEEK